MVARQARPAIKPNFCPTLAVGHSNHAAVALEVGAEATASKASRRDGGSDFPRFSARRSIPAHAVELKKNLDWIEPVSST
jgi:hypothetical protein